MAVITSRTFLFQSKNLLELFNEEWCRTIPFGSWSRLRFGILCAVSPNGTSNINDCTFFVGLSAGKTAPSSANNSTSFFGLSVIGAAAALSNRTLTYTAGANQPFTGHNNPYYTTTIGQVFRRINSNIQAVNFNTTSAILVPAGTGTQKRRCPLIVDIERQPGGGGAYNVSAWSVTAGVSAYDFRSEHLLQAVDTTLAPPVLFGQTLNAIIVNQQTVFGSDMMGTLDTLCVYWARSTYPLELYAVACNIITDEPYPSATFGGGFDTIESYTVGSITGAGTITGGGGFSATGVFSGTINFNGTSGQLFAGTTQGVPYDTFDVYGTGSIVSNSTINLGSGWQGSAFIYP